MARARRKSTRKNRRSSSGLGIFVMGMIVGSIGAVLGIGFFDDGPINDVGSGLRSLLNEPDRTGPPTAQTSSATEVPHASDFKFNYRELLLEEEYVLQPPTREKKAATQSPTTSAVTTVKKAAAPAQNAAVNEAASAVPPKPVADADSTYVIQVGSFRKYDDADRIKATMALHGLTTYIQKVSIEGRGDFFRVRMGPFERYAAVEAAADRLRQTQLNLEPLIFRIKASG